MTIQTTIHARAPAMVKFDQKYGTSMHSVGIDSLVSIEDSTDSHQ